MPLDPGLTPTPPMGFNTWNRFAGNISERLIEETIDAMVEQGLPSLGYAYLNIDDGWMASSRDRNGRLMPDPDRFPGGIAPLVERAHASGLKLGIYSCCGYQTCMGLPASYGHEQDDAERFASWGIDYLKQDWCHVPYDEFPGKTHRQVAEILYGRISQAMSDTGHPMVLSMCNWGDGEPWLWARGIAHLWRTTPDIADRYRKTEEGGAWDLVRIFRQNSRLTAYAGVGGWNDPDMLEVGNGGMTEVEYRSHFALWCLMAAPLLIGTDLRRLSAPTRAILGNRDLIAIDQDPLGRQAEVTEEADGVFTLSKPLKEGHWALGVFNATDVLQAVNVDWTALVGPGTHRVKEVWQGGEDTVNGRSLIEVPPHATLVWRTQASAQTEALSR